LNLTKTGCFAENFIQESILTVGKRQKNMNIENIMAVFLCQKKRENIEENIENF